MPYTSPPIQNTDGTWSISIQFKDKRRQPATKTLTIRTSTRTESAAQARAMCSDYAAGLFNPWSEGAPQRTSHTTVGQSIRAWLDHISPRWSENTKASVIPTIRRCADIIGEDLPMHTLEAADIETIFYARRYSWYTAERLRGRLQTWLKWAHRKEQLPAPITIGNPIKKHEKSISYITWGELNQIKAVIIKSARESARRPHINARQNHLWMVRFLTFMFIFGLRRQEALDVRVADVDTTYCILTIRNTKGSREDRIWYEGVELAEKTINRQLASLKSIGRHQPNRRLFLHAAGSRTGKTFKAYVRQALPPHRAAEIKMHSIRHGTATWLLRSMSVNQVKEWMRHKDIRTTLQYAKIIGSDLNKAAAKAFSELSHPPESTKKVTKK